MRCTQMHHDVFLANDMALPYTVKHGWFQNLWVALEYSMSSRFSVFGKLWLCVIFVWVWYWLSCVCLSVPNSSREAHIQSNLLLLCLYVMAAPDYILFIEAMIIKASWTISKNVKLTNYYIARCPAGILIQMLNYLNWIISSKQQLCKLLLEILLSHTSMSQHTVRRKQLLKSSHLTLYWFEGWNVKALATTQPYCRYWCNPPVAPKASIDLFEHVWNPLQAHL